MNGNYLYDNDLALTRVKQKARYVSPPRSRAALRQVNTIPPATRVMNVVSKLVQALSDARNELLTLLTCDGVRTARNAASAARARLNSSSRSPSRPFSAPTTSPSSRSRSPIRGDLGLGITHPNNSEYDHQNSHATPTGTSYSSYNTAPVSFGMNLEFENVHRGRSPPAGDNLRASGGRYQSMTANQRGTPRDGMQYSLSPFPAAYGERFKRLCTATRYADLLKEETYHLRERRLADESVSTPPSRPSWY